MAPEGIAFGQVLCECKNAAGVTFKKGECVARCAPNKFAADRGKWCVCPDKCSDHEYPDGFSAEDFTYTELPKGYDKSKLVIVIPPDHKLRGIQAPAPPKGHPAQIIAAARPVTEKRRTASPGRGKGRGAGGRGRDGPGKSRKLGFEGPSKTPIEGAPQARPGTRVG